MTAMMRHIRKQTLTIGLISAALCAVLSMGAESRADGLSPAFVTDPLTGVALDGMDPVSYFTDPEPRQGVSDYEYDWQGVAWYFVNPANRDAFAKSPATYAPQFGGHSAMSLARGYLSDGDPRIYLVVAKRLYLFYSAANRDAFALAPAAALDQARANWVRIAPSLQASRDPAGPAANPAMIKP
jgi:YHS domain-containing protein